jgi:hypothetical protein
LRWRHQRRGLGLPARAHEGRVDVLAQSRVAVCQVRWFCREQPRVFDLGRGDGKYWEISAWQAGARVTIRVSPYGRAHGAVS